MTAISICPVFFHSSLFSLLEAGTGNTTRTHARVTVRQRPHGFRLMLSEADTVVHTRTLEGARIKDSRYGC